MGDLDVPCIESHDYCPAKVGEGRKKLMASWSITGTARLRYTYRPNAYSMISCILRPFNRYEARTVLTDSIIIIESI